MTTTTTTNNNNNRDNNDNEHEITKDDQNQNSNQLGKQILDDEGFGDFGKQEGSNSSSSSISIKEGTAFDVIVVEGEDGTLFHNSDFLVSFKGEKKDKGGGSHNNTNTIVMKIEKSQEGDGDATADARWFQINNGGGDDDANDADNGEESNDAPSSDPMVALKSILKPGRNPISYFLLDAQGRPIGVAKAYIFLWKHDDSIVVSDIDGTITKSNARGVLGTIVTSQYGKVCHEGICHLLTALSAKSQVVYVTSRPIALANQTRKFLSNLRQQQSGDESLPHGPLLGFGGKMPKLLVMELVSHTTQKFKSGKLWQQVCKPFRQATNNDPNSPVFVAGFGNNLMDMQAYHAICMDISRIYKIDKKSQIVTFDKKINGDGGDGDGDGDGQGGNKTSSSNVDDGDFTFPPHDWYKDRIGTEFNGYTDAKLLYQFGFFDGDEKKKDHLKKYLAA